MGKSPRYTRTGQVACRFPQDKGMSPATPAALQPRPWSPQSHAGCPSHPGRAPAHTDRARSPRSHESCPGRVPVAPDRRLLQTATRARTARIRAARTNRYSPSKNSTMTCCR